MGGVHPGVGGKSFSTSSTGSLELFRRKDPHKIWQMDECGGRFNPVVGSNTLYLAPTIYHADK